MYSLIIVAASLLIIPASARDIVFPPVAAIHNNPASHQYPLTHEDPIDIVTGSQFSGLTTFANLPYLNCFVDDESTTTNNNYDIAFLGAPFDTVSHSLLLHLVIDRN